MGTTAGWRRNTSCDLVREEQEEDGCNGIGFSSKLLQKEEKQEEVKRVADNLLLYSRFLRKHADNKDGIFQSNFCLCEGWTSTS